MVHQPIQGSGQNMEQLQQQLQETKEQLQRLRNAIPLPPPHKVYSMIVNEFLEVDRCSRTVTSILRQIELISRSQSSPDCRAHRISIILLKIENIRILLTTSKLHLVTLLALPPLFFATGAITKELWDQWMARPFFNGKELVSTNPDRVKVVTEQLMTTLESYTATLSDFRESLQLEELEEDLLFHDELKNRLTRIQRIVEKLASQPGRSASAQQQRREQDLPVEHREEEDEEQELESEKSDEEDSDEEKSDEEDSDEDDMSDEEPPRVVQTKNELEKVGPVQRPRHVIETEIREQRRAARLLANFIEGIKSLPTCPLRRRGGGLPRSVALRHPPIKCAFCQATGSHQADACTYVRSVEERRTFVQQQKRCGRCLGQCPGNSTCRMFHAKCVYCKREGHNSALCELPDQALQTHAKLVEAQRQAEHHSRRIQELSDELRRQH